MLLGVGYGYSELSDISHYSVKVMCAELLLRKNGGQWPSLAAIFPQKAAPHTSLSHYNAKYQITRNSQFDILLVPNIRSTKIRNVSQN